MKKIKYSLLIAILAIFILPFLVPSSGVKAATLEELQNQIANLLKQIVQLQRQLAEAQGQPTQWCYDFNVNLRIGDAGAAVCSLRTALQKEGFETEIEKTEGGCKLTEEMASAISGFQQKYTDEILKPLGLRYGTGFLGQNTRAKLNNLFGCGVKPVVPIPTIPIPICNIFLTCEGGYTSYNTGEKDSQGCPIIKCVPTPTRVPLPIPTTPIPSVPTIAEQVKCVFYNSNTKQECYSSAGSGCAGAESCTTDVKGTKGEQITWKSSCGGYVYTTMDGQSEYAEFKCVPPVSICSDGIHKPGESWKSSDGCNTCSCQQNGLIACTMMACQPFPCIQVITPAKNPVTGDCKNFPTPCDVPSGWLKVDNCPVVTTPSFLTVASPNGGGTWIKGSTQIIKWISSSDINMVYIKLRKGSDTYPGPEGVIGGVGNTGTNPDPRIHTWTVPTTLPDGDDYAVRIVDASGRVYDDSDAFFSILTTLPQNYAPKIVGIPATPGGLRAGQTVNFSWSAQDEDNDDLFWQVSWGDNISMSSACPVKNSSNGQGWKFWPSHSWEQAGTYTVKVTVSDCKGGTAVQSFTVSVGEAATSTIPTTPTTSGIKSLTVISPNGGETWYMGKTYDILWKSSGVEKVYIAAKVFKDGVHVGSLGIASSLDNVSAAQGRYSWTPNSQHLLEGNQIKIEISNTEIPASGVSTPETLPSDESDNYFYIVSGGAGLMDIENMLASIAQAISQIADGIKELMRR